MKNARIHVLICLLFPMLLSGGLPGPRPWQPLATEDDPLIHMPGSQPHDGVVLEGPNRCLNCHSDYDPNAEPGSHWQGSMMAQAARDFIFWPAMTVAAQDAIWAVGNPNATDICLRCHFPMGWLEGRSSNTNGSLMTGDDYEGVQCDFCHRMYDPFFETTFAGTREGNDWLGYWDETNLSATRSQPAAQTTYQADIVQSAAIQLFNGNPFFVNKYPFSPQYTEATSGQYFVSTDAAKRAPFADHEARHAVQYSRFHKSKYFCGTCHDVSNPVLANLGQDGSLPLTTETQFAGSYFHVERTFSEFMLSAYGQQGGADGIGPYAPGVFETSLPGNKIGRCQDCHMYDVVGAGASLNNAPVRPTESTEHPKSGQPLHDLTGGNVWVSYVLASAVSGSPNYDPTNAQLLNQGPTVLTLDLTQGVGINPQALIDGSERAAIQLQLAAAIQNLSYNPVTGSLNFRVQNQTGHKLISGFPEGRRMFVNVRVFSGGVLVEEINPYNYSAGTLKGLAADVPLSVWERYEDPLVYEMHPSSSLTGEDKSLHFVLSDDREKDNRIPPKGFDISAAAGRLVQPRWDGHDAPNYYSAAEYLGGYDQVSLAVAAGADRVEVRLYYQTTSREYILFLRDEINGTADTLPSSAYIIQSDPFFSQLKAWGSTIWQLWQHNKDLPGAAPFLMTSAFVDVPTTPTATPTATASPTVTPTPTATNTASPTATFTSSPTASNTPVPPTATFTASPTASNTPVPPTATFTASPTATFTASPTASNTPVPPTATFTASPTASNTPVPPTATFTSSPTASNTPIPPTATFTASPTASSTTQPTATPEHDFHSFLPLLVQTTDADRRAAKTAWQK